MSEYQYYEFLAIDRPLDDADREALRRVSTRARITTTSFTNTYEWGDFKGDPAAFMTQWFDLHVHLTNWGTRRLMVRLPAQTVPRRRLEALLAKTDSAELTVAGPNLILDVGRDEVPDDDGVDGAGWLDDLAPLRAAAIAGDLRLFYLVWLMAIEADERAIDEREPLPGLGPLTAAHRAFAAFFAVDPDLVDAAAERGDPDRDRRSASAVRAMIAAIPERERIELLARLFEGGPDVAMALKGEMRRRLEPEPDDGGPPASARTVGALLARAREIRLARERAMREADAADRARKAAAAAQARRARLDDLARRGEGAWREVEAAIGRRNPVGYDRAADLLSDLRALAEEREALEDFLGRLRAIRVRHARKENLIRRLAPIG